MESDRSLSFLLALSCYIFPLFVLAFLLFLHARISFFLAFNFPVPILV